MKNCPIHENDEPCTCGPMHQNTDWEKEFDELFCYRDSKDGRMKLHAMTAFADNYKDFIRSLLQAREEWLKGEIEKMKQTHVHDKKCTEDEILFCVKDREYNQTRNRVLSAVLSLINKK